MLQANKPKKPKEYSTDEEELAKDTEWIRIINIKRKISLSSPQQYAQAHQSPLRKNQGKAVVNKFKKAIQPPPVILVTVKNYNELYDILKDNIENKAIEDLLILIKLNKQEVIINEVIKRMTKIKTNSNKNRSKKKKSNDQISKKFVLKL